MYLFYINVYFVFFLEEVKKPRREPNFYNPKIYSYGILKFKVIKLLFLSCTNVVCRTFRKTKK